MREIFTSGTVGGALGNQCFYPEMHTLPVTEVSYLTRSNETLGHPSFQTDLLYDVQILTC